MLRFSFWCLRPSPRTSFHHQPEAQHLKSSAIHKLGTADYPIFTPESRHQSHASAFLIWARKRTRFLQQAELINYRDAFDRMGAMGRRASPGSKAKCWLREYQGAVKPNSTAGSSWRT